MRRILLVLTLLCLGCQTHPSLAEEAPEKNTPTHFSMPESYARALFPQAEHWDSLQKMPFPETLRTPEILSELNRQVLLSQEIYGEFDCHEGLPFPDPGSLSSSLHTFRQADLNGDGRPDIFFTGYAACREGTASLIWFAAPEGGYRFEKHSKLYGSIVLVEPPQAGQLPHFITYAPGCCGDSQDTYYQQSIENQMDWRNASNWMSAPSSFLAEVIADYSGKRVNIPGFLVLRLSPKEENDFDAGVSDFWGITCIGNIQAVLLNQGQKKNNNATLLAWSENGEWGLLALDESSGLEEIFSSGYPQDCALGWAHKKQFTLDGP